MGELKYTREILEGFFSWKMETCLHHFDNETNAEEIAKAFAFQYSEIVGFITFKSEYRGRRFFWINRGESYEMDAVECYLRVKEMDKPQSEPVDPKADIKRRLQEIVLKGEGK